ncbi:MAG: hypothetical protein JSV36_08365 [Anaerolineae bacterium]|nr:MAG: hypothetical protein JSV36_08365 [Anaerolineae bacterium]
MITLKSIFAAILPIKHYVAPLHAVFIGLYTPLSLGGNKMWVITSAF